MHDRQDHSFTALTTHITKTKFNQPLMTLAKESVEPIMQHQKVTILTVHFFQGSTFKHLSHPSIIWQDSASN